MALRIARIRPDQLSLAREAFRLLARVLEEPCESLDDEYCQSLLGDPRFWVFTASDGDAVVGAVTAWALPLTSRPKQEMMIYDLAVDASHQRRGIRSELIATLIAHAKDHSIDVAWVPAANEDSGALDFYRAIGGKAEPSTIYVFGG